MRRVAHRLTIALLLLAGLAGVAGGGLRSAAEAQAHPTNRAPLAQSGMWPRSDDAVQVVGAQAVSQAIPPARYRQVAAWDADDAQMLVFGGMTGNSTLLQDLWGYRPVDNAWTELTPPGPLPAGRVAAAAAWDPVDKELLLFGGSNAAQLDDLWAYRPTAGAWTRLTPGGPRPSARSQHTAVWDPIDKQLLVYGGFSGGGTLSDLWAYRPATNTWLQLAAQGNLPTARSDQAAVWDAKENQMLVFAGNDGTNDLADLWAYRPATSSWSLLSPTGSTPAARSGAGATWDTANGRMLVYGGLNGNGFTGLGFFNDLWVYQPGSNSWAQQSLAGGSPAGRATFGAAWDPAGRQMLVFGGTNRLGVFGDAWSYRPATSAWMVLSARPPGRNGHTAVWDAADKRMLVFGGANAMVNFDDLWTYDPAGNVWSPVSPSGGPPTARLFHSAAWDALNAQLLIFGGISLGNSNDLWRFKPGNTTWLQLSPALGPPSARDSATAVWDPVDNEMLLYGGFGDTATLGDLWAYRPAVSTWIQLTPVGASPPARGGQTAVWDVPDKEMLVFAGDNGQTSFNDLWAYQPSTNAWTQLHPTGGPPGVRSFHSAVWDTADAEMLVFGGGVGATNLNDVWAYRPATNSWTQLTFPGGPPSARNSHTAVWDDADNRMVIFGGKDNTRRDLSDVWLFRPPAVPPVTATPTPSPTPTLTATPTATQRPNLGLRTVPTGAGRLQTTITARATGCSPNGELKSVHVTRTDNATVDIADRVGLSGDVTVPIPPRTAQVTMIVHRVTAGQASTVSLVVTDGCGPWPTFVGGGPNAF